MTLALAKEGLQLQYQYHGAVLRPSGPLGLLSSIEKRLKEDIDTLAARDIGGARTYRYGMHGLEQWSTA